MKKVLFISLLVLISTMIFGQNITGDWTGAIKIQGMELHLVFHITKTNTGFSATMDSPDQGAKGIPMTKVTYENKVLTIEMVAANINYSGTLDKNGVITGTFNQPGQTFPLILTRIEVEKTVEKQTVEQLKTKQVNVNDISGEWNGVLKPAGMQLRLVFHVTKTDAGYSATMDSPDQGAKGIPASKTTFENQVLIVELAAMQIEYSGKLDSGYVNGTFKQAGMSLPLKLTRQASEKVELKRPQNPVKPYPYYSEDVTFENKTAGITLAGTLTLTKMVGKFPVVVLITGSGPQNRDEELMGHKPFLVLSDYLTRNGIAVLRYDDRGTFESKGNFAKSTTFDFATDVEAAVKYLKTRKEIDPKHIGLIGHSEGGIIAPIVAVNDKDVSFIVLMAGTGISGGDLLLRQQEQIGLVSGMKVEDLKANAKINQEIYKIICSTSDSTKLKNEISTFLTENFKNVPASEIPKGMSEKELINLQLAQLNSPWMLNFIRYNPEPMLEKVKCPVLAINGDKDLQVPSKVNLPAIENALKKGGNKKYSIKELLGLNHLFQECKTGLPKEYSEIEQTISPLALETMTNWIKETIK